MDRPRLEAVFVESLPLIDRIVNSLCRRYGFSADDCDDFRSCVNERLIEDEYAVLRKFRGEAAIGTYLTVVIAMILRDYRVRRWGRWRPSAAALRAGNVAVRLESLVYRQRFQLDEAIRIMKASGETMLTDREIAAMFSRLPRRAPLRLVDAGPASLTGLPSNECADDLVNDGVATDERSAADRALHAALSRLPAEDRLVLRMRFWEGMSIADIARALGLPQKPLYRRVEHSVAALRPLLEAAGVSSDTTRELIESAPRSSA
jgi:RNA polymerase sigma factor for flagellar operon FliA